jgi:colanic acid biosynthesis glycosyl transferase WcaI
MSLRVLVVTQYFWPENFRINELVGELVSRGNQVTVLTGVPNYPDGVVFPDYRAAPRQFAQYRGAEVVRIPMWPRGRGSLNLMLNYFTYALSASVLGAWKLRGRKFDVIFMSQFSPVTSGIPAVVIRRLKRIPLVFWVLDKWPETLEAVGAVKSPRILKLVGRMVSSIYARCDLILAQSRAMMTLIEKYTAPGERIGYFPNWCEAMADPREAVLAPELPPKDGKFDVMFAGNIGESQDFGSILSAAEHLRDEPGIRWLIVGDGRAAPWVREEIVRRGLQSSFIMLGRHAPDRMPQFYKQADAMLLALRDEPVFALTVPGKLQSYMYAGLPVLGMLNGEGGRIIEQSGAGFACGASDAATLANLVRRMASLDAAAREEMGNRGREYALREYNRDTLVAGLEDQMKNLVDDHVRGGRRLRRWASARDV